jgi:hypothetical protein
MLVKVMNRNMTDRFRRTEYSPYYNYRFLVELNAVDAFESTPDIECFPRIYFCEAENALGWVKSWV